MQVHIYCLEETKLNKLNHSSLSCHFHHHVMCGMNVVAEQLYISCDDDRLID